MKNDHARNMHCVPEKKLICLWGLLITTYDFKDDLPYIFRTLMSFSQHNANRLQSHRSGGYFSGYFSKESWLAVYINEARSAPKGTKSWVVCVLKDFLAIYQRPSIRISLNWKDNVENVSLLFTNCTSYEDIQRSVHVLERFEISNN